MIDSTNATLRDGLLRRLTDEEQRAHEKMSNPSYWRDVGHVELAAVHDIRQCLLQVPDSLPPATYLAQITAALQKLATAWRADERDEDGYGVATVHAVGTLLPDYVI